MIHVYLERKEYANITILHLIDERENGDRYHAQPVKLVFKKLDEGLCVEPFLEIGGSHGQRFLQELANALAVAGFKVDTSTERGELVATKKHLEREKEISDRCHSLVSRLIGEREIEK